VFQALGKAVYSGSDGVAGKSRYGSFYFRPLFFIKIYVLCWVELYSFVSYIRPAEQGEAHETEEMTHEGMWIERGSQIIRHVDLRRRVPHKVLLLDKSLKTRRKTLNKEDDRRKDK
jgi:hypothetical protein